MNGLRSRLTFIAKLHSRSRSPTLMRASSHTRRNKPIGGGEINGGDEAHGRPPRERTRACAHARNEPLPPPSHLASEKTEVVVAKGRGSRHRRMRGRSAALVTRGRCVRRAQRGRAHLATSGAATTGRGGSPVCAYSSGRSWTASTSFAQPHNSSLTAGRGDGGLEVEDHSGEAGRTGRVVSEDEAVRK